MLPIKKWVSLLISFISLILVCRSARAQSLPNLTPYQPAGWWDKMIVSNVPGSKTDTLPLKSTDTIYVSWAVINSGTAPTAARFYVKLFVDGIETNAWYQDPPLYPGYYLYKTDYPLGPLSAGFHTLRIVADATGFINESAEYDNEYSKTILVVNPDHPDLAPYAPPGWSAQIVVSNRIGSTVDGGSLSAADTLYVGWAVINNGAVATAARFAVKLFLDGTERNTWYSDPPLGSGHYLYINDYPIGPLSAGTHTFRIVADATGAILEGNESNNEYTKTITIASTACFPLTAKANISQGGSLAITQPSNCSLSGTALATTPDFIDSPSSEIQDQSQSTERGNPIAGQFQRRGPEAAETFRRLTEKAIQNGKVKVIIGLDGGSNAIWTAASSTLPAREQTISPVQERFLRSLGNRNLGQVKRLRYSPFVSIDVDATLLQVLEETPEVISVEEDVPTEPELAQSAPLIGATAAWANGYTGAGQTLAILDSGIDSSHPFLGGKVVSEACFSTNGVTSNGSVRSLCPGQALQAYDQGSGLNCDASVDGCDHGTHVAGIAAGHGPDFSGIARDAAIISIQVFSRFDAAADCSNSAPCARSYRTDQLQGLERVLDLSYSYKIAAVNMSLGSGNYSESCDWVFPSMKVVLDQLRARGIATIIPSGNGSSATGISFPACLSNAISVGSTDDGSNGTVSDSVSSYSNSAAILNLLAPGRWIRSSVPGGGYADWAGTSMAAPHVAGAWAVIRSKFPSAGIDQILETISLTAKPVADSKNGIIKPRIQLDAALDALGSIKSGQFTSGTPVTVNATANPGFRVTVWTGCDSFSGNSCTVAMNGPRTVTASFAAIILAPPVILSSGATSVSLTSAQLNATVNPNGLSTAVNFQWGTTPAYGLTTSYQITDTSSSSVPVSVPVAGLTPDTTYYYQVVASNASGGAAPVTGSFTTLNGGVVLPDLTVESFSASTAVITGGQITVDAVVRNNGAGEAGIFRAGFYLSADNVIDTGDIFTGWLCNFDNGLKAGASDKCSGSIGIPSSVLPGTYVLGVIADDTRVVAEENEGNNTREADTGLLVVSRGDEVSLNIDPGGAKVVSTNGVSNETHAGYATLQVNSGSAPYGTAVFTWRQNGVVVSEAGVPASPPTTLSRIFVEFRSDIPAVPGRPGAGSISVNTGIAVVNGSPSTAQITYTLRAPTGDILASGHGILVGNHHFACFIDHLKDSAAPDFKLPADFQTAFQFGSLEISSDQPVAVLALRGTSNQRNEFLITTTPVADLTKPANTGEYFPQFVDGGGYTTSLVLLNTSSRREGGALQILDNAGMPLAIKQAGGTSGSSFIYSIPPGGTYRFQSDGSAMTTTAGWARLIPDAYSEIPIGSGVFGYNPENILISESGIPAAAATTHARIYVDLSRNHNTGLAISNLDSSPEDIQIKAFRTDGVTEVGASQGPFRLLPGGHEARFAESFITGLPTGFRGVMDISATKPFAALTLRSLMNERNEFLMTTLPIADLNKAAPFPAVFPHIADGNGYLTEFILISSSGAASTTLSFFDESGAPTDFAY
jgi:subtilisin